MKHSLKLSQLSLAVLMALPLLASQAYADTKLKTIDVEGTKSTDIRDRAGHDAVYEANFSSDYVGQRRINAYRGTSPSDVLKNFAGVYSGESRNGGAIDPNVRGIQGPGRVPVTVDGTEQAMTVSRGYNGATNRNYIDPMLIGSMHLVKDGGWNGNPNMKTSIGGGLAIRTIDAEDILHGRKGFGGEVKIESSSNSTAFESPTNYNGYYLNQIPYKVKGCSEKIAASCAYLRQMPIKTQGQANNFLSGHDMAGRIALAYAGNNWSIMGAYAYRQRGNYYAGKNNAGYYKQRVGDVKEGSPWDFGQAMTKFYAPGSEVANTAAKTKSYLLKLDVRPSDTQALQLGFTRTEAQFGEILPIGIMDSSEVGYDELNPPVNNVVDQIPLSSINLNTYHLNYRIKPHNNKWLDLKLGLWATDAKGIQENRPFGVYNGIETLVPVNKLSDKSKIRFSDTRYGFNLSNTFHINPKVDLTLLGSMQHRKYNADDYYHPYPGQYASATPMKGRSTESAIGFNVEVRPNDRLTIDLGSTWSAYRLHDDGMQQLIDDVKNHKLSADSQLNPYNSYNNQLKVGWKYATGKLIPAGKSSILKDDNISYKDFSENRSHKFPQLVESWNKESLAAQQAYDDSDTVNDTFNNNYGYGKKYDLTFTYKGKTFKTTIQSPKGPPPDDIYDDSTANKIWNDAEAKFVEWYYDNFFKDTLVDVPAYIKPEDPVNVLPGPDGKYTFANDPCFNGTFKGQDRQNFCTGIKPEYKKDSVNYSYVEKKTLQPVVLKKGHAWTPSISLAYQLTDNARIYARYDESVRYPDILEDTIMFGGFGSPVEYVAHTGYNSLKPEHSHNFEIGYVQNLQGLFPNAEAADFRIAYYQNRITDVIERQGIFSFVNLDSQTIKGLEFNGRYDSGRFFGSLGMNYILEDKVCDENTAVIFSKIMSDTTNQIVQIPKCVKNGFFWGFLGNQAPPRFSATLDLGARLMNRRLELGGRLSYYSKYKGDFEKLTRSQPEAMWSRGNPPYTWGSTLVVDAYARYKINKHFDMELSGTNLTDQYYVDPASRSLMPAPGRTIKLSVTGRF